MDVMPIYIIDRKFPDISGKSLTQTKRSCKAVPSVCVGASMCVCVCERMCECARVCARASVLLVRPCCFSDTGQRAPVDHATPLGVSDVQQEMRSWHAFLGCEARCVR